MTEEPLYNIGVVTRVTGISIPTLHAWERRYGFPKAARSAGGHRLYSEKDIARLRWIKSQVDSGLIVSRAIAAAQSLEEGGHLLMPGASEAVAHPKQTPAKSNLPEGLFEALIHHDLPGADRLMGEMLAFTSPEDLTLNVIGPALARIGDAWEAGQITVATEHLASNYLRHRLLMWMVTGPTARSSNPIILACAPGEWHEGSLLMLGVLLRRRGWPVAYLGQNVPFHSLSDFIQDIQPPAILLVAMREESARKLVDWPQWIPQLGGKPLVAFGGRAFVIKPEYQQMVPGYYLGDGIQEGITKLESLLR
jgi:DNA-binding transcriptional MerR regulator